jgi:hypothetical protein
MIEDETVTHVAIPITLNQFEVPSYVHLMREQEEWRAVWKRVICNYHTCTSWSRVPLENLTVSQLVKKFPAFYGIRRFVTSFKISHQLSL